MGLKLRFVAAPKLSHNSAGEAIDKKSLFIK
jgi:hypothetical protein